MAIKVIAQRSEVKLGKNPGKKFVMRPDLYIPIQEKKVFAEASTHSYGSGDSDPLYFRNCKKAISDVHQSR